MAKRRLIGAGLGLVALLSGCGGGGGGGSLATVPGGSGSTPTPTAPSAACSLAERQNWVLAQMREWYLFPETLPATINASAYSTLDDYVDALTATARSQRKDRFFTYVTSIREENAYYSSGQTAGFGVRFDYTPTELRVLEAFEGAPALAAGIDRGTRITGIGTTAADIRSVSTIYGNGGTQAVVDALGPSTAGTSRVLQITTPDGASRTVTVAKTDYTLQPVSDRYGTRILDDGGRKIGYLNLRTFISTADPQLRAAFQQFRDAGVTELVVDLRYNGGGLVRTAELIGDLMGRDRFSSDIFSYTTFRPEKSAENEQRSFAPQPQSIALTRVAFIGTGGTASASELLMNAFIPYLGANGALIGANTYGKPVGQIALDRSACDDRLRVVAFATQNRDRQGAYYDGLATVMPATCRASDDIAYPLGDPRETSIATALAFLAGRSCTPIAAAAGTEASGRSLAPRRELLIPDQPTTAQRETPGLF